MPKNILNTPEYFEVRSMIRKKKYMFHNRFWGERV